jgi:hypothetical protein
MLNNIQVIKRAEIVRSIGATTNGAAHLQDAGIGITIHVWRIFRSAVGDTVDKRDPISDSNP